MKTCRHGHPLTADNIVQVRGYDRCLTCKRTVGVRANRKRREALLSPVQVSFLRRAGSGLPLDDGGCDPTTRRSLSRRGLIVHSAGGYRLTEAGEQALAAYAP